jgi:hypothetical protein
VFLIPKKGKYKEPDFNNPIELDLKGIYIDEESYAPLNSGDSGQVVKTFTPQIICLWSDDIKQIVKGSTVTINGDKYSVLSCINLMQLNLCGEINLQRMQ